MTIVFLSNFFNHHQQPLAEALTRMPGVTFWFIETRLISEERLKLGWGQGDKPSYVRQNYVSDEAKTECQHLIDEADIVIWGGAPYELLRNRLQNNKLTFLYSERIYKKGYELHKLPHRIVRHYLRFSRHKNLYLLCASAYASADFAITGCFWNKAYKWGYFTETKTYEDVDRLIAEKEQNSILWVARFLALKHPEAAVEVARRLKADGYDFCLNMIGNGEQQERTAQLIAENGLEDCVHLLGSMQPQQVRAYMEKSEIFLFTSDKNEGWGAVANEAMNSGCAVVASHAIGSVPFLLKNQENGLIYESGNVDMLYRQVKYLLDHPEEKNRYAKVAYASIATMWNADVAAERLVHISERLLSGKVVWSFFENGPCSRAERIRDHWFKG